MKRITIISTLIIITITGLFAMGNSRINSPTALRSKTDFDKLWKEYNATVRADRALKGMKVLEEIKALAEEERSSWNFYRAANQYWQTGSQRDWKQEDSLRNAFLAEIERYNEPIITFYNSRNNIGGKAAFLKEHREQMLASHNPDFYEASYPSQRVFSGFLNASLSNDYEYALWYLYLGSRVLFTPEWEECRDMLKEYVGDKYPFVQFIEFNHAYQSNAGISLTICMQEFADKYKDRAVALFATQELLNEEFSELAKKKASSDEYKAFRQKCADFETYRDKFKGSEKKIADCCTKVRDIIAQMDAKFIEASVSDGKITISTQNIEKVDIALLTMDRKGNTGKTAHKAAVRNTIRSYYLLDTLTYDIPSIDDGIYSLVCSEGKVKSISDYNRYTVSISDKDDKDGHHIYAAEAVSGRPLKNAAVSLVNEDDQVIAIAEGLDFSDGYIALPKAIKDAVNSSKTQYLICSHTDADGVLHSSPNYYMYERYRYSNDSGKDTYYAQLIVDRSAFNPDETVHFKAVVFHGDRRESLQTVPEGEKVTVYLRDVENNTLETRELSTNEFGSVAGEFVLARGKKNGQYSIELYRKGYRLDSRKVQVDDFVLPTFSLTFEPDGRFYLPGDKLTVKGRVTSYSGHTLSGADISCVISEFGNVMAEEKVEVGSDGSFSISFDSDKQRSAYYRIDVKVTDNTGETLSWSTSRNTFVHIPFTMSILNQADGEVEFIRKKNNTRFVAQHIVSDDVLNLLFDVNSYGQTLKRDELKISYKLTYGGAVIASGNAEPGEKLDLSLSGRPSGLYQLEAESICPWGGFDELKVESECDILLVRDTDTAVDADIENVFKVIDGDQIGLLFGTTAGETWANVDVYGVGNVLLAHRFVNLSGAKGKKGSLERILFDFEESWSNIVDIQVLYFRNNRCHSYSHRYDRSAKRLVMPLGFTRFEDRTAPGKEYTFEISTLAGVECAATVFDKSTESIMPNVWSQVHLYSPEAPDVVIRNECGKNESFSHYVTAYGASRGRGRAKLNAEFEDIVLDEEVSAGMPLPSPPRRDAGRVQMNMAPAAPQAKSAEAEEIEQETVEPVMRENFANTIAFEPYLRSDEQGRIQFSFKNADKLSTYYVQLWAHDRDMHNAVLRREMVVSIPVKVSVVEPQFLYTGDKYMIQASVSSTVSESVAGRLRVECFDGVGGPLISTAEKSVTLKALASEGYEFPIHVPAVSELCVRLSFIAASREHGSDAVMVKVPVSPAVQTITEAHSAILQSGESKEELLASLRAMFVNTSGDNAEVRDLSILDMVREAVPGHIEPASKNLLDMTDALYARRLAATLAVGGKASAEASGEEKTVVEVTDSQLVSDILACRNTDGGFAWFAGMDSSPVITATVLSRIASLRQHGLMDESLAAVFDAKIIARAVAYLDKSYFGERGRPEWCGGISFSQYIAVRSCFSEVELKTKDLNRSELRSFRKDVRSYLVPTRERGLNGAVLGKARRMRVMYQLISSEDGSSLAKSWGIRLFTMHRLNKSLRQDFDSLMEYAIEHRSGGWYFPNAVMPFRGLLETEAYAHVFLCDIIEDCASMYEYEGLAAQPDVVSDGLRLWLMVQKETQKWDESPAFVEALSTILAGSDEVLSTRIITLSKTVELPFSAVKKAENGMRVTRSFAVKRVENDREVYVPLAEGEALNVGDVIKAEYKIWNEENRSFVRLSAPRMASMRPVQQLSGRYGWWLSPLRIAGWYTFSPQGYRNVLRNGSEYWFDSYPEEHTTLSEEFYITQAGEFQMPAMEIECLYAPHYRANDAAHAAIRSLKAR